MQRSQLLNITRYLSSIKLRVAVTPRDAQRGELDGAESIVGRGIARSSSGIMTSMGLLLGEPEMAVVVLGQDRSGVELEVRAEERLRVPNWFGEAMLLGRYWLVSGLVGYLEEEVRVVRGRMGWYEVADFVLLLNSYAISGERTLAISSKP